MRVVRLQFIIGSTVEEIQTAFNEIFKDLCPGNLIRTTLTKLGDVYQYEVLYAEFIDPQVTQFPSAS